MGMTKCSAAWGACVLSRRECREGVDDELDLRSELQGRARIALMLGRIAHDLDTLLNDVIAVLIVNALHRLADELMHQRNELLDAQHLVGRGARAYQDVALEQQQPLTGAPRALFVRRGSRTFEARDRPRSLSAAPRGLRAVPWCLRQGRAWEDVWRAELLSRVAAENTPRTVLEQLLDHVISEDVDHQLGRAWEDLDENGLLLTVARGLEPLLNVPRSVLVLAKRDDLSTDLLQFPGARLAVRRAELLQQRRAAAAASALLPRLGARGAALFATIAPTRARIAPFLSTAPTSPTRRSSRARRRSARRTAAPP